MSTTTPGIKFFSSAMQAIAVQVIGSLFFYFASIYLTKGDFGIISWMNAVCVVITTLLGFGLEHVVVRRVATSRSSDWAATAFLLHSVAGFVVVLLLLVLLRNQAGVFSFLPWFFLAQGLIYIGVPLKSFLNAKEQFTPYGIIAVISNVCKIIAVYFLLYFNSLSAHTIIIVLVIAALFEWTCLVIYVIIKTTFSFKLRFKAYIKLLKEASTQYLSVIFDIGLSRMDWILLGIISSNAVLADYSFAYRAFELSQLPLLVIAPMILPRFARLLVNSNNEAGGDLQLISSFARVELFFAVLIPLTLNILWTPLVTIITKGKYGDTNALHFFILSMCIPLQVFINLLWSISFGARKYRQVSHITVLSAIFNIVLNLVLIPRWGGIGAATAFLFTTLLQAGLYFKMVNKRIMVIAIWPTIIFIATATVVYVVTMLIHVHYLLQLLIAISAYITIGTFLRQINRQHLHNFRLFLSR